MGNSVLWVGLGRDKLLPWKKERLGLFLRGGHPCEQRKAWSLTRGPSEDFRSVRDKGQS